MSVLERLARVSQARRSARRSERDGGQPGRHPRVASGHVVATGRGGRPAEAARRAGSCWSSTGPTSAQLADATRPSMAKGQKSLFFCQSRAHDRGRRRAHASRRHRRLRAPQRRLARGAASSPRSASTAARTRASSARRPSSSASTSAISTACSRPRRPTPSARSCSAWAAPGGARARPRTRRSSARPPKACCRRSPSIELAKAGWVEDVDVERRCWPVLIHQLLAMSLASDGITAEDAWAHLSRVPDFRGIHRAEFDRLVEWMLRDGALRLASGRLVLGPKAERRFGRRNFMELFAVFSSPQTYTVQTPSGQPLGTLNQDFVDRLVDGISCFLLGGRAWAVLARPARRPARHRRSPLPAADSRPGAASCPSSSASRCASAILRVLTDGETFGYLDDAAASGAAPSTATRCRRTWRPAEAASRSTATRSAGGPSPADASTPRCATRSRRSAATGRSSPTTS